MNILLVDDHKVMVDGLTSVLKTQPDFKVIATAHDSQEAISRCNGLTERDLVVMDINLSEGGPNGFELTRRIKKEFPGIKVLILSMYNEIAYILEAKKAGANGFISKTASGLETVHVIREIGSGNDTWPPGHDIDPDNFPPKPTPTELKVLKYVSKGLMTAKIGIELAMPEATVSAHRHHIMQKYNLQTQGELKDFSKECMELYGIPPDPIFAEVLEEYLAKVKEKMNIDVEFEGEKDAFDNPTTQALSRVMEEVSNNIKHRNQSKGAQRTTKLSMELKRDSSEIRFIILHDGKESETLIRSKGNDGYESARKILKAIGGGLNVTVTDSTTCVIAALRPKTRPPKGRRFFSFLT